MKKFLTTYKKEKGLYLIFLTAFLIHLAVVLFIYYTGFRPFGGGADFEGYNKIAIEIAQRFRQGNFSLEGLSINHYFPLLIGIIYTLTSPKMIVGQLFTAWLAAISVLLVYLIVVEISGSKKWAFLIGLIVCFYPSYLYFGSLLLKDTLIVPLVLAGLLLSIKMIKNFSWQKFLIFYIILTCSIHLRFYIGYALLFSFILCWFLTSVLNLKKRVIYGIIIVFLLGFSPQILGYGYYGTNSIKHYFNQETITAYRETAYAPPETPKTPEASIPPSETLPSEASSDSLSGSGSTFTVETSFESPSKFLKGYLETFIYSLLGPFPWQIRYQRQLFALLETMPWYVLFLIIIWGIIKSIKRKGVLKSINYYRFSLPLLFFAIISLTAFSLFITNFGVIARIRIPVFISFFCLIPLSFSSENRFFKNKVCHIANADMAVRFLLLGQLKFLRDQGYKVYAVCSAGNLIKDIEKQGIEVKIINFNRGFNFFIHLITFFKLFFYFKKEKFDIVHTHTPVPGFLGQLAAKMAGTPIIINTIHGFYFSENSSLFQRKILILAERIVAKCSDLIFSQSEEDIKTAIKEKICSAQKIRYLGNGVDVQRFNPRRFSKEFIDKKKQELRLGFNFKIIGIVGRLVKEKGYLELFEAFGKIIKQFPETLLLVIGPEEPKKKDKIDQKIVKNYGIERNVLFLGQRTDIEELYPLFDIFVLPSHREGFPRTIIEAQAASRPVIATNIRGCREIIEDGKTGILVPLNNPEKIAEAIIYLFENPEMAKKIGEEGRKKAEKEFDERLIFEKIKKEYQRLI